MLRNFTLDDASPLIRYDATWDDGFNSSFDDQFAKYQGQSFQCTNIDGATANLTFRGTAIYVYGAKRSNHGYYRVAMNGEENPAVSGRPPSGQPNQFQTVSWVRSNICGNVPESLILRHRVAVVQQRRITGRGKYYGVDKYSGGRWVRLCGY
ncbi:hypothetical protein AG1IA_07086 [Rhizoctonia solani AG-1 IA]|uniref:Uncharacterized protein n=1 Tax=Thanatephorus cucumeris (strain AG1-IA) TaxID=983506 RepID=L8WLR9_THACA|nr:hypothetical protein AG1IA_09974 [Rhizoctonia solani AG-1 IA]ELU38890.1 hypothetical protein AG1IA_07086 [Rhizoctonia solani AG-1 IA]